MTYFTSGYGICFLVLFIMFLLTQEDVQVGEFGLWGFPIIALFYAIIRTSIDSAAIPPKRRLGPPMPHPEED